MAHAAEASERVLGAAHPYTVSRAKGLADILQDAGDMGDLEARESTVSIDGPTSPWKPGQLLSIYHPESPDLRHIQEHRQSLQVLMIWAAVLGNKWMSTSQFAL